MTDERHPFPPIDPDRPGQIVLIVGRKHSGKSVHARELFKDWPGVDRLVIDPHGDAEPMPIRDPTEPGKLIEPTKVTGKPPTALPPREGGKPVVMWWVANPGSPTYRDDLDRAVGAALTPRDRPTLLWTDEAGEVFPSNRLGPHARTLLHQSRHWNVHAVITGPRPLTIDKLCRGQADRVVMYDLPDPDDRKAIASSIGWDVRQLTSELEETRRRGEHWFTLYESREHALYRCPPLRVKLPANTQ